MQKRKQIVNYSLIISLVMLMISCMAPNSKKDYINRFEKFVNRVQENHKNYNKNDWKWADSQFNKYNKEWYLNYKGEYTLEDQIKIKGLVLEYNSYKKKEDFGKIIKELFEEDVDDIKEKLEEYIDEEMEGDLDKLINGAAEIGDSAVKVLEEIIDKIDHSF